MNRRDRSEGRHTLDEAETQRLLRAEIAELRAALDDRFREIAALTRMQEDAEAHHPEDLQRQAARLKAEAELNGVLEQSRTVFGAGGSKQATALRKQQRALLAKDPLFDAGWYLERNPDVAESGMDPREHYMTAGTFEGRDPGPAFSSRGYYLANPDVAGSGWSALGHYLAFGRKEGRSGGPDRARQSDP